MVVYVCGRSGGISTANLGWARAGVEVATGAVPLWGSAQPRTLQGAEPPLPMPTERKNERVKLQEHTWEKCILETSNWKQLERAREQEWGENISAFFKHCGTQLRCTATHVNTVQAPQLLSVFHTSSLLA